MAISKIQILDNIYDFTVPSLEEKIGDLTRQLDIIKAKLEGIECTEYATKADIYAIMDQFRSETKVTIENPEQKFDLEIFEVIEASNPFLQNLK